MFEPFYRLNGRNRGAGLGLNLVQEIVRRHDGEVAIREGPSGGACVEMMFKPAHAHLVDASPHLPFARVLRRDNFSLRAATRNVRTTSIPHIASVPTSVGDAV